MVDRDFVRLPAHPMAKPRDSGTIEAGRIALCEALGDRVVRFETARAATADLG